MLRLPIPSLNGLRTERLEFRSPRPDDASWWMEYINDADAIRFMPFTLGSTDDCALFIQRALDRIEKDGSGLHVISDRKTQKPLGMVGLLTQEVDGIQELEIGFHLLPSAWGRGYATEAAIACRDLAKGQDLASSVISLIDKANLKSGAVALRVGMRFEKLGLHRGESVNMFRMML